MYDHLFKKHNWVLDNNKWTKHINPLWLSFIKITDLNDIYLEITQGNDEIIEKIEKRKKKKLNDNIIESIIVDKEIYDDLLSYKVTEYETYLKAINNSWNLCDCWRRHEQISNTLVTYTKDNNSITTSYSYDCYNIEYNYQLIYTTNNLTEFNLLIRQLLT